jgi:hypothetical protein
MRRRPQLPRRRKPKPKRSGGETQGGEPQARSALTAGGVPSAVIRRLATASEYLRHCGYRVIEAISAEEAITVLSSDDINRR